MKGSVHVRGALGICATVAALSGCGGSQPPGATPQSVGIAVPDEIGFPSHYHVLYSFRGGHDGAYPAAGLVNMNGMLYGTTSGVPETKDFGTVFSVTTTGTEKVLYRFRGGSDGAEPGAALTGVNGMLYGTTIEGGIGCSGYHPPGCGTVFEVSRSGAEKVLHRFGGRSDGATPFASLISEKSTLYGTTYRGGKKPKNFGTVFSITTTGTEKVLYSFVGGDDGGLPYAGLINVQGTLYGTTGHGGGNYDAGTVYSISATGAEKVLYSFVGGYDGAQPIASLINVHGTLYGTTASGGGSSCSYGCGTIFSVTTTGEEKLLHSFANHYYDGAYPEASLTNVNGTLYGTTFYGGGVGCGGLGCGILFSVTRAGTEKVLHKFGYGSDGGNPIATLINVKGTLYGTTATGGAYGHGTVFAFTP